MARIPLRIYHREIENLIEHGEYDQAVAHCRHILKFYPKSVDTYRLMGKAYLENQRYGDASDILQRVLSSALDDFVSHVGMSIIREDEGNLDDAIWHMERAFEVQPANSAIQGELRRLYGRRDGFEPPKINLTRGALARMYIKGGLHQQAVAELRIALTEDPQRPDLLMLLCRAYFLNGQKAEAAETCNNLYGRFPFCVEANHLLGDILAETDRATEARDFESRYYSLVPYAAHVSSNTPTPDQVPESAVLVERLDWKPGQSPTDLPSQPDWATSLGVQIGDISTDKDTLPDWLISPGDEVVSPEEEGQPRNEEVSKEEDLTLPWETTKPTQTGGSTIINEMEEPQIPASPAPSPDSVPGWMREAGWEASPGSGEEPPTISPLEHELPPDEIAPADIPDWLTSLAPEESLEEEKGLPEISPESHVTPSEQEPLQEAGRKDEVLPWLEETTPGPTDSVVTWLNDMETKESTISTGEKISPTTEGEGELVFKPKEGENVIPDWLGKEEPEQKKEMPSWVLESDAAPSMPQTETFSSLEKEFIEDKDTEPFEQPIEEEISKKESIDQISEWLKGLEQEGESKKGIITAEPKLEEKYEIPEMSTDTEEPVISSDVTEGVLINGKDADAAFAWLENLAAKQGAQEALLLNPEDRLEEPPDWVKEATSETDKSKLPDAAQILPTQQPDYGTELSKKPEEEIPPTDAVLPEWLRKDLLPFMEEAPFTSDSETAETEGEVAEEIVELPSWLDEKVEEQLPPEGLPTKLVTESRQSFDEMPTRFEKEEGEIPLTEGIPGHIEPHQALFPEAITPEPTEAEALPETLKAEPFLAESQDVSAPPSQTTIEAVGDETQTALNQARQQLNKGQSVEALTIYQSLVKSKQHLTEIIEDLSQASYRFPMDVSLWQTLGDAYMRSNQLQSAIEAYTKAEELLR